MAGTGKNVTKRNGVKEPYAPSKIKKSIKSAFDASHKDIPDTKLDSIVESVSSYDGINVEDIQNQVETILMKEEFYDVAKNYILYRQRHETDRDISKRVKFLTDYCNASNAATGSKYDSNANVENKNMATLIGELPKEMFIRINRRILTDRIKKLYGKDLADKYLDLLNNHFIYKNDETSLASYCASITMYPWLTTGTKSIGGNSTAPTNLRSFCGGFINMVFMVSSMLSGACATPEFLMYMNYFIGLEYGQDYYKHPDKIVDLSNKQRTIDKIITDCFEQICYSINQPTGARNFQSVFWNIAYYDENYFKALFGNFYFPDGSQPDWDSLSWLQKRFMKWFNAERQRCVLTFPVETMALLSENGDIKDKEYADFTAEMYSEGHSFFTYVSDNADSLSSCCFEGDEIIEVVKDDKVYHTSIKNFVEQFTTEENSIGINIDTKYKINSFNFFRNPIHHDTIKEFEKQTESLTDITGVLRKSYTGKMYTFTFDNGRYLKVTADHPFIILLNTDVLVEMTAEEVYDKWLNHGKASFALPTTHIHTYSLINSVHEEYVTDKIVYDIQLKENHYFSANSIITHNCRLRNELKDNGFSYTLGAGGVSTGSKSVLTINLNRCIQYGKKHYDNYLIFLEEVVDLCHKVQICYNENLKELQSKGMLPLFDAGYINLGRQYLTIGVNGLVEAAEYLGIEINDNEKYRNFVQNVLGLIEIYNKKYYSKGRGLMFNCEMIPAENVGVKHAKWDKEDGYFVPRDCYNSYFYIVEDPNTNVLDKFRLHGKNYIEHLTGGSALHCNLEEHLSKQQYRQLLRVAAKEGCNYFTFNIPNTVCEDCGYIDKRYLKECPHCHSKNVTWITRIIGYLKKINSFSEARQKEAAKRYYANSNKDIENA